MENCIGLLLPRSTDYPALGFDLLDGLRFSLENRGMGNVRTLAENIGFGEDAAINYSKAEKLILTDNVDAIVAYANASIAETLYPLAEASGKPFIFLDPSMQFPSVAPSPNCFHISLQGIHACRTSGALAGKDNKKVLMATSFYEGGYRGSFGYVRGLQEAGGSVCGNFISGYKEADFTIQQYMQLLQHSGAQTVAAVFSSYLADLFIKALKEQPDATALPFYCSPFMAEEQMLSKCDFPGGTFQAVVTWATSLKNEQQDVFMNTIQQKKNKTANIFHLLGWEAAIVFQQIIANGMAAMAGFSYDSPRGRVTIHPETHNSYSPLYKGLIKAGENGKCVLDIEEEINVSADDHVRVLNDKPEEGSVVSGWKNNYLCI
jgi:branched-chain amino acid transport system substrate-binding protein